MEKKKIVIIGGSGFIGSHLIELLKEDYDVQNLDKNQLHQFPTSLCDITSVEQIRNTLPACDIVVLLAAEHKDNVSPISLYYEVNVEGTRNVLQVMNEKGIKSIIFTSTVAVYGLNKINPDESQPADPFNHYGKSKFQAEELLREWYHQNPSENSLTIIRPTVVFGPKNKGNVYNLLQQILKRKFKMVGNGKNIKSMSYVENVTSFIKFLIDNHSIGYKLYNYVDKPDLTTNELIEVISKSAKVPVSPIHIPYGIGYMAGLAFDALSKITGKEFSISSIRIKKFCSTTQFSNKKVQESGFKAPYSLQEGLDITINSLIS